MATNFTHAACYLMSLAEADAFRALGTAGELADKIGIRGHIWLEEDLEFGTPVLDLVAFVTEKERIDLLALLEAEL